MWYNIDFTKFAWLLLPPTLRQKRLFAFVKVFVLPIIFIFGLFDSYRKQITKRIQINGQVIYLEKLLNDEFQLTEGEIFIGDIPMPYNYVRSEQETEETVYLTSEAEASTPTYVYQPDEGSYEGNFRVNVPSFLDDERYLSHIRNLLDYYRPAGMAYKISIYDYI